jgi:hypothetical protein
MRQDTKQLDTTKLGRKRGKKIKNYKKINKNEYGCTVLFLIDGG